MKNGSPPTWDTGKIQALAKTCSDRTGHSTNDWQEAITRALGRLMGANLDLEFFEKLTPCFESPEHLLWFSNELCGLAKHKASPTTFWQELQTHITTSQFTYQDWMSAFLVMKSWLEKNNAQAPLTDCFSYILCCEEALLKTGAPASLSESLKDFLESEGFHSATPRR